MREWPSLLGLILLVPAVLFGVVRASETLRGISEMGDKISLFDSEGIGDLPGVEILASARRSDQEAAQYVVTKPRRIPFAAPSIRKARPVAKERTGIPMIVTVLADGGTIAVVLKSGGIISGPLSVGETFQEWNVLDVSWEMILLSKGGINYSLPVQKR